MKHSGGCLCGLVRYEFTPKGKHFDTCHCSMCRKWGGGPSFAVEADGDIQFSGEEHLSLYQSSKWAERGFCKKCGTHLFYRLLNHPYCNFNLGTIDKSDEFQFTTQIFVDFKPDNYDFANKTKMMTEKDVMEAFGAES